MHLLKKTKFKTNQNRLSSSSLKIQKHLRKEANHQGLMNQSQKTNRLQCRQKNQIADGPGDAAEAAYFSHSC